MNMIWFIAGLIITFLVNIPFGFWRTHAKRSGSRLEWALAVHLPVPLVIVLRRLAGLSWNASGIPFILIFVLAYFLGQRTGGKLYNRAVENGFEPGRNIFNLLAIRGKEGEAI
ncbi:hypothetical membrane protein, conserved [Thermococcus kodakarensis KOD1]|uniref:Hypothetical membrane protein, conserved n=1 Tax=Thermococcus kodakarensis (strain ATCC BAA-918 / JCM 12380 / KOD1) TaxID=69014 RepID=Q5JGV5_THEKO|nr:hypothetical protein [Thermococcus kodakarensis]WCN29331.1 hypothetical protein POG15_06780 [Thermococcus kodakarensis]WCN31625.1 hypothetical protein POG21_06770 [Thermococcus kodakarensis]BAD85522.1 hypothetical membrane protein, conserved [Thermococcus kodakarensis KOD1]